MGSSLLFRTLTCQENHFIVKLAAVGIVGQSYFFFGRMLKILQARWKEYSERKVRGVKLRWMTPLSGKEIQKVDAYNKARGKDSKATIP